jgi:hypothetical protein
VCDHQCPLAIDEPWNLLDTPLSTELLQYLPMYSCSSLLRIQLKCAPLNNILCVRISASKNHETHKTGLHRDRHFLGDPLPHHNVKVDTGLIFERTIVPVGLLGHGCRIRDTRVHNTTQVVYNKIKVFHTFRTLGATGVILCWNAMATANICSV